MYQTELCPTPSFFYDHCPQKKEECSVCPVKALKWSGSPKYLVARI